MESDINYPKSKAFNIFLRMLQLTLGLGVHHLRGGARRKELPEWIIQNSGDTHRSCVSHQLHRADHRQVQRYSPQGRLWHFLSAWIDRPRIGILLLTQRGTQKLGLCSHQCLLSVLRWSHSALRPHRLFHPCPSALVGPKIHKLSR